MTHTLAEITAMIERLEDHARNVGGDPSYHRLYGSEACEAAAMLREVAAERDALVADNAELKGGC